MILCFELSMPGVSSWNGRWSGERNYYAIIKNLGRSQKADKKAQSILDGGYYSYDFGDGWRAAIKVKKVDTKEAARIRRKSKGFCGYDWMVDEILENGKIKDKGK